MVDHLTQKFPGGPLNSRRFPGGFLNSSRFPGFPGVVDTLSLLAVFSIAFSVLFIHFGNEEYNMW